LPNRATIRDRLEKLLSSLFRQEMTVRFFLEDAGVQDELILPWGVVSRLFYWRAVCQQVDFGIIPSEKLKELGVPDGLTALVRTALIPGKYYPGNPELLRLRADLETLNVAKQPAPAVVLKMLFLGASPVDMQSLRIGRELRAIQEGVKHPGLPVQVELKDFLAAEPDKILSAIVREKPDLVHFAGHGVENGSIALEGPAGERVLVGADRLGRLFQETNQPPNLRPTRCVILNACHSAAAAREISRSVDVVIGTDTEIGDDAALAFTQGFYLGLADGRSIGNAIELGKVQMDLVSGGEDTNSRDLAAAPDPNQSVVSPKRFIVVPRSGVNPNQLFLSQPGR
jgi:hypothetical protein